MNSNGSTHEAVETILDLLGPLRVRNCPLQPTARQEAFLRLNVLEALYGGAAGGGKTIALLMAALQYTDVPGYHGIILRPTLTEFDLPGGLIELSHDWLAAGNAQWVGDTRTWRFPGPGRTGSDGASLRFGYLDGINDVARYAGSSFSFLGFDELVRFDETEYQRMFRVLRQPQPSPNAPAAPDGLTLTDVPLRARATSNPGGPGHPWVKARFVDPHTRADHAVFMPSRLTDNPYLNQDDYLASLSVLPNAERERLLHGDWEIPDDGELFQRTWFEIIGPHHVPPSTRVVRFWDLAATEPGPANPDPDYTVGLRYELDTQTGTYYISDLVRARKTPAAVEQLVAETAERDGVGVSIVLEEEPGASGKAFTDRYKRHVLRGYDVRSLRPTGAKDVRARIVAAAAENGLIKIVRGRHTTDLLNELTSFPHGAHDDCVDALTGAHHAIEGRVEIPMRTFRSRGRFMTQHERFAPFHPW
jgi:predicted phage terminase large subunit-like protein